MTATTTAVFAALLAALASAHDRTEVGCRCGWNGPDAEHDTHRGDAIADELAAGHVILDRRHIVEDWTLTHHPGWPDGLEVLPATAENAQRVWERYPHPEAEITHRIRTKPVVMITARDPGKICRCTDADWYQTTFWRCCRRCGGRPAPSSPLSPYGPDRRP